LISRVELEKCCNEFRMGLTKTEVNIIFNALDKDGSGKEIYIFYVF